MFDYLFLVFTCPYCRQKSMMEFQIKDLSNSGKRFKIGDRVHSDLEFIDVTGCCRSPECQEHADKYACSIQGKPTGFGALFRAN